MSQMATIPVYACRGCGKAVYAVHLSIHNDPNNERLKDAMQNLQKIALCKICKMRHDYYASQGRTDEFYANTFNPHAVIYNVVDNSGADYYKRREQ